MSAYILNINIIDLKRKKKTIDFVRFVSILLFFCFRKIRNSFPNT